MTHDTRGAARRTRLLPLLAGWWVTNAGWTLALCLILGVAILLMVREARVPIPVRYGYDEGVYAATADAVAHGSRLYRDVFLSQPPVFVLIMRAMFGLWGTSLAVARSTAVVLASLWLIAILAIVWARASPWAGLFAVCLVVGRATFLDAAHTVEMELPAEALACGAVGLAAWGVCRRGHAPWVGAGMLAAFATMTKLTAATSAIPLAVAAVSASGPASRMRWRMLVAGGLLGVGILLPVLGAPGFVDQVVTFHSALARKIDEPVATHLATIGQFLAAEWPLSLAALLGAWRAVAGGAALERALVAWTFADGALLAALTPLWPHHLMILLSPMALLAGLALRPRGPRGSALGRGPANDRGSALLGRLSTLLRAPRRAGRVVIPAGLAVCAIAYLGLGMSAADWPAPSPQLERGVRWIAEAVPLGGRVLTDDPIVAFLAGRRVPDGIIDSSLTRIWAGQISEERLIALLGDKGTGAVVLWRGTFREYFPGLASAAATEFPVTVTAPGGRVLLLRRPDPHHP